VVISRIKMVVGDAWVVVFQNGERGKGGLEGPKRSTALEDDQKQGER